MGRVNFDVHYFLEEHEQEIINCCKKAMSNNEVRELYLSILFQSRLK